MTAWARALHGTVATAMRDARRGRFTAEQLAQETDRLNYPVSRAQISNYESGRKHNLDICELLILAGALNVPPLVLLFPGQPDRTVHVLPGRSTNTAQAKQAFVGDHGLLWPGNEINALIQQLHHIQAGMAGMAGMGALAATAAAMTDEITRRQ